VIDGKPVEREARPASITWPIPQQQQNTITVARLERDLALAVGDKAFFRLTASVDKPEVQQGDRVTLKLKVERLAPDFKAPVQVNLLNLPGQPRPQPITVAPDKN
jgi:hypothetical protein